MLTCFLPIVVHASGETSAWWDATRTPRLPLLPLPSGRLMRRNEGESVMTVHLVNPSHLSFGVGVITPRWLFVLAGATPADYGVPHIVDETLEQFDLDSVQAGDIVGIGIHTGNALRGYEIGKRAARGARSSCSAASTPRCIRTRRTARGRARGRSRRRRRHLAARPRGRACTARCKRPTRADASTPIASCRRAGICCRKGRYMWGSVQTVRGCPKHCSFCSVWRTDGQKPRQRGVDSRRRGDRRAPSPGVPVRRARRRQLLSGDAGGPGDGRAPAQRAAARTAADAAGRAIRADGAARRSCPSDMVFFTQITMEAAEDEAFLDAMRRANIKGALVGVEAVTPEGLKDVYKGFNDVGEALVQRLRKFRKHGVHVLGSFIFGLPSDRPSTFEATADIAERAGLAFAQFVMLTPYPGTVDFEAWEKRRWRGRRAGRPASRSRAIG